MPDGEQEVGVVFPLAGLETTCEFGRQPVDTTPAGVNVRSNESITERARGGSRTGLSQYIPAQVNSVSSPVQHLDILVDPQNTALDAPVDDVAGETMVTDPSTNNASTRNFGRRVRSGGGGQQPNRNDPRQTNHIELVRGYRVQPGIISTVYPVMLPVQPGIQSLLLVIVRTEVTGGAPEQVAAVRNAILDDFHQVGDSGYFATTTFDIGAGTSTQTITMFWRSANAGVNDQTVRVYPGASGIYEIIVLEFRYAASAGAVSNNIKANSDAAADPWALGTLATNGTSGQAVVVATTLINTIATINSGGYVAHYGVNGDPNLISVVSNTTVIAKYGVNGAVPETPVIGDSFHARPWAGVAVALTK